MRKFFKKSGKRSTEASSSSAESLSTASTVDLPAGRVERAQTETSLSPRASSSDMNVKGTTSRTISTNKPLSSLSSPNSASRSKAPEAPSMAFQEYRMPDYVPSPTSPPPSTSISNSAMAFQEYRVPDVPATAASPMAFQEYRVPEVPSPSSTLSYSQNFGANQNFVANTNSGTAVAFQEYRMPDAFTGAPMAFQEYAIPGSIPSGNAAPTGKSGRPLDREVQQLCAQFGLPDGEWVDEWLRVPGADKMYPVALETFLSTVQEHSDDPGDTRAIDALGIILKYVYSASLVSQSLYLRLRLLLGPMQWMSRLAVRLLAQPGFYPLMERACAQRLLAEAAALGSDAQHALLLPSPFASPLPVVLRTDGLEVREISVGVNAQMQLVVAGVPVDDGVVGVLEKLKENEGRPLCEGLIVEPGFHGNLSLDAAGNVLLNAQPGSYLLRFSTQEGSFTVSEMLPAKPGDAASVKHVRHTRLRIVADGWVSEESTGKKWKSLDSFIEKAKWETTVYSPTGLYLVQKKNYFK